VLKRSWAGEVRNVSLLVAIGVNKSGYREKKTARASGNPAQQNYKPSHRQPLKI
jgi:transposase-like protein